MTLRTLASLAAALALAGAAAASEGFPISQTTIGGAAPGLSKQRYRALLGPQRAGEDHLEGGLVRLTFPRRKTEVYFRVDGNAGIGVVTWNGAWRDAAGIGPCSPVADLKAAYAGKLHVAARVAGKAVAYRLGRLVYGAEGRTVGSVMLATAALPVAAVLNSEECRR